MYISGWSDTYCTRSISLAFHNQTQQKNTPENSHDNGKNPTIWVDVSPILRWWCSVVNDSFPGVGTFFINSTCKSDSRSVYKPRFPWWVSKAWSFGRNLRESRGPVFICPGVVFGSVPFWVFLLGWCWYNPYIYMTYMTCVCVYIYIYDIMT